MKNVKYAFLVLSVLVVMVLISGCQRPCTQGEFSKFVDRHEIVLQPMEIDASLAWWDAANSGEEEDYDRAAEMSKRIQELYSDSEDYRFLKCVKDADSVSDPVLKRQLGLLYDGYLVNQGDEKLNKELIERGTELEKLFNTHRGEVDGKKVTTNEIKEMLKKETDNELRKKAWLASKQVGPVVAPGLIELVKLRNKKARQLGYDNYHTMVLTLSELDVEELDAIFDELVAMTDQSYREMKSELDSILACKYDVSISQVMPWHYHDPFLQDAPQVYETDLDVYYEDHDVVQLTEEYFAGIGLPVESIIAKADLFEREGKNPHAFCMDVDKEGDVRVLCNVKNDERWMGTMLHELGHGVYDYYNDPEVPYLLRNPAHIFTTEAIAMMFGRLSRNADWMQQMLNLTDGQREDIAEVSDKYLQMSALIFARWATVMYEFEKELYANPNQDLNALWWDLRQKYQLLNRPADRDEPDWASKIHFTTAPCYYHNYMLGDLLASQLHTYIVREVLELPSDEGVSFVGDERIGTYLRKNIFEPGDVYRWDEMIERATGENLTAKYFAEQFVND